MSNDLTALLERAADEAPATRPTLTDGAVRRGTTLRRRRRAAQGLASLSVAAVVVGGLALAAGWDDASAPRHRVPSASEDVRVPDRVADAPRLVPARSIDEALAAAFAPYGTVSDVVHGDGWEDGDRYAGATLTDAVGPASINAGVADRRSHVLHIGTTELGQVVESCADLDLSAVPDFGCTEVAGAVIVSGRTRTYQDERDRGEYSLDLTAFRADGLVTWISSYNAAAEKGGVNRAAPPLTLDELEEIATDDIWSTVGLD